MTNRPNAERMARIKQRLAGRDGACCFYCRRPFPDLAPATVDHFIPQSLIPGWRLPNLVLACLPCNNAKADTLPQLLVRPLPCRPGLRPAPWLAIVLHRLAVRVTEYTARPTRTTRRRGESVPGPARLVTPPTVAAIR
ncbi:MAG TPA: HNH endonuclease [Micromonosporaceae bacterium]